MGVTTLLSNKGKTVRSGFLRGGQANEKYSDRWHSQMEWIPEGECSRQKRNSEHGKNTRIAAAKAVSTKVKQVKQIASGACPVPKSKEKNWEDIFAGKCGAMQIGGVGCCAAAAVREESDTITSKAHSWKVSRGGRWDEEKSPSSAWQAMVNTKQSNDTKLRPQRDMNWDKFDSKWVNRRSRQITNKSMFTLAKCQCDCWLSSAFPKRVFTSHGKGDGQHLSLAKRSCLTGSKVSYKGLSQRYSFPVSFPSSKGNHAVYTVFSHHGTGTAEEVLLKEKKQDPSPCFLCCSAVASGKEVTVGSALLSPVTLGQRCSLK